MKKTFVLDTNVLLHDPEALFAFDEHNIILPITVVQELDNQKRRTDQVGLNAREISRQIDSLRESGSLSEGVKLPNGGYLRIELNHKVVDQEKFPFDMNIADARILCVAYNLKQTLKDHEVILVTKDLNLRIMADVLKIKAEEFFSDRIDFKNLYTGWKTTNISGKHIDTLYEEGILPIKEIILNSEYEQFLDLYPHQFCIVTDGFKKSCLARYSNGILYTLKYGDSEVCGIRALNKEQRFALELLMDDDIPVVSLLGCAGSGKTLLALAAAVEKVVTTKHPKYNRVLVMRSLDAVDKKDLGYFPGEKDEKIRPWMQPIHDNLEFLVGRDYEKYLDLNIECDVISYTRGRSIPKQFIVIDDSQNLSPKNIKTILTRVGHKSKIVFTGDPDPAQIDNPYLDSASNGITYVTENTKTWDISGHITLTKGERSKIAELAARMK